MAVTDVLDFLAPAREGIAHLRFLKRVDGKGAALLIAFHTPEHMAEFADAFHTKRFNFLEEDTCEVALVEHFDDEQAGGTREHDAHAKAHHKDGQQHDGCPICLDSLRHSKEHEHVVQILCNHAFHRDCLARCEELACPICRFELAHTSTNVCGNCDISEGLWMCLTCGHVGCSRAQWHGFGAAPLLSGGHALAHYNTTHHPYAQSLDDQRVWVYPADRYCQHLGEGPEALKLVEFTVPEQHFRHASVEAHEEEESSDSLNLEYTFLLAQQLEAQRRQFADEVAEIEKRCVAKTEASRRALAEKTALYEKMSQDLGLQTKKLALLVSQCDKLDAEVRKAQERLGEEDALLQSLEANQGAWAAKLEDKQRTVREAIKRKEEVLESVNAQLSQLFSQL